MKENLKTYSTDGKWMSAFRWKEAFKKELRELYEDDVNYISKKDVIKEILGE